MKEGSMELPIGDIFQNTDKDKLSIGVKLYTNRETTVQSDKPKKH